VVLPEGGDAPGVGGKSGLGSGARRAAGGGGAEGAPAGEALGELGLDAGGLRGEEGLRFFEVGLGAMFSGKSWA